MIHLIGHPQSRVGIIFTDGTLYQAAIIEPYLITEKQILKQLLIYCFFFLGGV
jgi:hypothetical protein